MNPLLQSTLGYLIFGIIFVLTYRFVQKIKIRGNKNDIIKIKKASIVLWSILISFMLIMASFGFIEYNTNWFPAKITTQITDIRSVSGLDNLIPSQFQKIYITTTNGNIGVSNSGGLSKNQDVGEALVMRLNSNNSLMNNVTVLESERLDGWLSESYTIILSDGEKFIFENN